jgi:hypothetical protein
VANIGHPERRRYTRRDLWRDFVPVALMILFVWAILIGTPSQNDLKRVERTDRNTGRATAYRLCTRNKDDRAYAHTRERGLAILKADGTWIPPTPMIRPASGSWRARWRSGRGWSPRSTRTGTSARRCRSWRSGSWSPRSGRI